MKNEKSFSNWIDDVFAAAGWLMVCIVSIGGMSALFYVTGIIEVAGCLLN
jgi:hypothetical protein